MPAPGARLPSRAWLASDIMTRDFTMIPPDTTVAKALHVAEPSDAPALLVGIDGSYEGIVVRDQMEQALLSGNADSPIRDLMMTDCAHAHPDHPLEVVLDRLHKNPGLLPIVSRERVREVRGIVTPQSVMHFLQKTWGDPSPPVVTQEEPSSN